jgi:NIPSNAP protein
MSRRRFLGGAVGLGAGVTMGQAKAAQASPEVYELRQYHLRIGPQPSRLGDYLREAAIPAWNRLGLQPIGVFDAAFGEGPTVFVLLPHPNLESVASLSARLEGDSEHRRAGAAFLEAPAVDPPYSSLQSELLVAFDSMPKIEIPPATAAKGPRLFELRTYLSHSEAAHKKKMEMFTPRMGELEIFRRTGLAPVFFGRAVSSFRLPSFTYMLAFADEGARAKAWGAFVNDPDWKKLSATPGYSDPEILASITSVILRPTSYSQI